MPTYVLIIMISLFGASADISMHEFTSKENCEIAGQMALDNKPREAIRFKYVCVEK